MKGAEEKAAETEDADSRREKVMSLVPYVIEQTSGVSVPMIFTPDC